MEQNNLEPMASINVDNNNITTVSSSNNTNITNNTNIVNTSTSNYNLPRLISGAFSVSLGLGVFAFAGATCGFFNATIDEGRNPSEDARKGAIVAMAVGVTWEVANKFKDYILSYIDSALAEMGNTKVDSEPTRQSDSTVPSANNQSLATRTNNYQAQTLLQPQTPRITTVCINVTSAPDSDNISLNRVQAVSPTLGRAV